MLLINNDFVYSYPPKKKKYPGISRNIVEVRPRNSPETPEETKCLIDKTF